MTPKEIIELTKLKTNRKDYVLSEDMLFTIIHLAMIKIAYKCTPHMLCCEKTNELLRYDKKVIIRRPKKPTNKEEVIDIDYELCIVVVSLLCADIDKNKSFYLQEANDLINDYRSATSDMALANQTKK